MRVQFYVMMEEELCSILSFGLFSLVFFAIGTGLLGFTLGSIFALGLVSFVPALFCYALGGFMMWQTFRVIRRVRQETHTHSTERKLTIVAETPIREQGRLAEAA